MQPCESANKREIQHTLVDSQYCCLTACQRTKNTKGQSAICEGTEYKKIQDAFLEVMKKQKMQGVVFTDFVFF